MRHDDPSGKSLACFRAPHVQPLLKKYSDFQKSQITLYPQPSRSSEGRCATSRNAERDAVDVEVPLTNGTDADGEVVWS